MSAEALFPLQGSGREPASCTFSWFQSLVLGYSVPDCLSSQGLWYGLSFSSLTALVFAYKTSSLDSSFITFAKFLCQNWVLDTGSGQTPVGIHCWVYYHRLRISHREVSVCVLSLTFSSTKLLQVLDFRLMSPTGLSLTQISGKLTLTQQPKSVLITTGKVVLWNTQRARGKKNNNPGEFLDCLQNK